MWFKWDYSDFINPIFQNGMYICLYFNRVILKFDINLFQCTMYVKFILQFQLSGGDLGINITLMKVISYLFDINIMSVKCIIQFQIAGEGGEPLNVPLLVLCFININVRAFLYIFFCVLFPNKFPQTIKTRGISYLWISWENN